MKVKCIREPQGDIGLEGFCRELIYDLIQKPNWYQLYENGEKRDGTSKIRAFWKYFTEVI
jgi:hypothetical protein